MLLSEDHLAVQDAVRSFVQAEIAPHAAAWDKSHQFPAAQLRGLAALGCYGVAVPEAWGGAGLDYLALALIIEEVAARIMGRIAAAAAGPAKAVAAEAPESVKPATTAKIVANATAEMNPKNTLPPTAFATNTAAILAEPPPPLIIPFAVSANSGLVNTKVIAPKPMMKIKT